MYVASIDTNGIWLNVISSTGSGVGNDITVDQNSKVAVVGVLSSTFTFLPLSNINKIGVTDGFITYFDSTITPIWLAQGGNGDSTVVFMSLTFDKNGDIYVYSRFNEGVKMVNSAQLGGNLFTFPGNGSGVSKISFIGRWNWINRINNFFIEDNPFHLTIDQFRTSTVIGSISQNIVFPNAQPIVDGSSSVNTSVSHGPLSSIVAGNVDVGVVALSPNGIPVWSLSCGGDSSNTIFIPIDIITDNLGDIYIFMQKLTSSTSGNAHFGKITIPYDQQRTFFVAKISEGQFIWATNITVSLVQGGDITMGGIDVDCDNNVIVFGGYLGTIKFSDDITFSSRILELFIGKASQDRLGKSLGLLKESGGVGDLLEVDFDDISRSRSGLAPGTSYYLDSDGKLTHDCQCGNPPFGDACADNILILSRRPTN